MVTLPRGNRADGDKIVLLPPESSTNPISGTKVVWINDFHLESCPETVHPLEHVTYTLQSKSLD